MPHLPLLLLRDLLAFPQNGDNSSDTVINGVHFNLTSLQYWNYTYYSNNTISNGSNCYLIFDQYQPVYYSNGSWVNATSCYVPIYGVGKRGKIGIAFGVAFALTIMFTLVNLNKHGKMWLREDRRFRIVGRRWQWYWLLFTAACGIISCITSLDVDRDYLQQIAIVLQSFFYFLMVPGTLAAVWEGVRHWGSWSERQIVDRDPFTLPQDDRRGKTEFYLPLIFYAFALLSFFMVIPRSWSAIQDQSSLQQQTQIAEPMATDIRFKVGSIFATLAYFTIIFDLHHNLQNYYPHDRGLWKNFDNFLANTPARLFLSIIVLAIKIAYTIASAWEWEISVMKYDVQAAWPYGLGYGPSLLIIIILNIWGYIDRNEDLQLIDQRRARGRAIDAELGIVRKPAWWSKGRGDSHLTDEQRLRNFTREIGGGAPTARHVAQNIELGNMNIPRSTGLSGASVQRDSEITADAEGLRDRSRSRPRDDPFRDPVGEVDRGRSANLRPAFGRETSNVTTGSDETARSGMTGTTINAQPQVVRSMLDI